MKKFIINSSAPIRTLRAVCVDTHIQRNVRTSWGTKNQVKFVFETEELKGNGYPRTASRTLNQSYYEKGHLRLVLESWLGRALTAAEMLEGFPFRNLVGKAAELEVQDARAEDGTAFLSIVSVRPSLGNPLKPSGSYRRWEDPSAAKAKAPRPLRTTPTVPTEAEGDEQDLAAQAERHLADRDDGEAQEPTDHSDNVPTVPVSAHA